MADARGEYWYFEPGVDANKITVPELRSILLKHGITYPSSAKKPTLVSLFDDAVAPQAAKVRRAYAHTKRSAKGIVDVPSSSAGTTTTNDASDAEEETMLAPLSASIKRASRRTTRIATEEIEAHIPTSRGKTSSRAVSTKHSRAVENDLDERPNARKARKSEASVVVEPSLDPVAWHRKDASSPFTQENPFQSGSSPALRESTVWDRRRRTTGLVQKEKRKSDAHRRKTVQPRAGQAEQGIVVPTRGTFDVADPRDKYENEDSDDFGAEFSPEEQAELAQDEAKAGAVAIPSRRHNGTAKAARTLKAMAATLLFSAAVVFAGVWRQEKISVGFCGVGSEPTSLAGVDIPDWAGHVLPQCEPCPPHAQCLRGLDVRCETDFIRKEHPLSLNGLIPRPPTCEPDSEKTRKVTLVADRTIQMLRQRKAQHECGEPDQVGNSVDSPELSEKELKLRMNSEKRRGMSDQEFNELFDKAFGEVSMREEIVQMTNVTTGEKVIASTSLAELSLACSIRRSLRRSFERYLLQIIVVFLLVTSGSYGRYSFNNSRAMETRAKQLASDAFARLANQAALSAQEPGAYQEKGISMAQLRDDVLRDEFSSSRRQKLWERVQKKVEFNSNVRAAVRTTNSGDVARMWEWIGPIQMLEDGRRSSGQVNPQIESSPPPDPREKGEGVRWDEGRPIY